MGIGDWLKEQKTKAEAGIKQFANKDFMEAIAAGCALIASADGDISSEEKQKMVGYINLNDSLKVFKLNDVLTRFNHYADMFAFDYNVGKAEAMKSITKMKSKTDAGKTLIAVCCSIGAADGNFDKEEVALVKEMCSNLGVNPADFKL
ncbi:tellurite resistance TerB family protein [Clostridium sp.]|jgi:tellurite resistance protein TerB|uniref:tellurite resistance TerB family protein n=1 Tax=Clostridium sp. TaxID=1506 RepID=UPI003D6CCE5F